LKHKKGEGLTYFFQQVAIIADEKTSLETLKTSYSDDNIKKIIEKFPLPSKTLITFRDQRISELEAKKPKESGETEEREPQPKKKEVVVKTYDVDGSDKDKTKSEEDITKTEYDNFLNEKGITDPNHRKI
jgi:hypothetical protein